MSRARLKWEPIIDHARGIVEELDIPPTLRQLFYLLVSDQTFPNEHTNNKQLSSRTAELRYLGEFPPLIDLTRHIEEPFSFDSPESALAWLARNYQRDRTEGQTYATYIVVEKATLVGQLSAWFGDDLGIPIVALRGYGSQTYIDEVVAHIERDGRPALILYAGDFDPSGEDIRRHFTERVSDTSHVRTVALTPEQVNDLGLPVNPGKETDSRAKAFEARYGGLFQVEVEALSPAQLRGLFETALDAEWDRSQYEAVLDQEEQDRAALEALEIEEAE
jgi:hypothetical protein